MVEGKKQYRIGEDDGFKVQVQVVKPVLKESGMSKYYVYSIVGQDEEGTFEVFRRYSDFYALRQTLYQRWPGVFIPAVPPKKATGNLDQQFVEERRKFLEIFMQELSRLKYLWYSQEVNIFIRSTNPDVEKAFAALPKQYIEDLIKKYEGVFQSIIQNQVNTELDTKIAGFAQFLKKINEQLEKYRAMIKNLIQVRVSHNDEFKKFITFLLPEYEKNCLSEYVCNIVDGKFLFADNADNEYAQIVQNLQQFLQKDEFGTLNELLKLEIWEVDCFNEIIQQKSDYEKLLATTEDKLKDLQKELYKSQDGKTSKLKNIFSTKSKDQVETELKQKIEQIQKEIENQTVIIRQIKIIIGYYEIDQFKNQKLQKYYEVVKQLANFELEFAQRRAELWQHIVDNENVLTA